MTLFAIIVLGFRHEKRWDFHKTNGA